jgi:hypothetical protein
MNLFARGILVAKGGIEPPTQGFSERCSVRDHFLIKLLQHTPSFKSSHPQPYEH